MTPDLLFLFIEISVHTHFNRKMMDSGAILIDFFATSTIHEGYKAETRNRMSQNPHQNTDNVDQDPVWNLLDHASMHHANPRFADDVVRLARLDADRPQPWWLRWMAPVPVAALASATAAVFIGYVAFRPSDTPVSPPPSVVSQEDVAEQRIAHLQEVVETEMLFAAVENMDQFSDAELISLIGF